MKTYAIFLENTSKPLTEQAINKHVQHLKDLDSKGILVLCGPFEDYPGGMVLVTCKDIESAQTIAKSDPFVSGDYRTYTIRTLEVANKDNNYLL
ncbi:YciI family protein [Fusibacter sp. JL216-2]|uniref:YciI family protein n=1 Tax=Fusibacter sp. JL216-2 TaxID=3071453 RepID=UPI003D34E5C7